MKCNVLMKCNEAISDVYYYNLLAETLAVFGLIAYNVMERLFSSIDYFFLTEKSKHSFAYKISMNIALDKKVGDHSSATPHRSLEYAVLEGTREDH